MLPLLSLSSLCGGLPQNNSHAGTPGTLGTYGSTRSPDIHRKESIPRFGRCGRSALPRLPWACYPLKSSRIFPVAEGVVQVVHRVWSQPLLPAPLRGSACVRAGSPGAPQEGAEFQELQKKVGEFILTNGLHF